MDSGDAYVYEARSGKAITVCKELRSRAPERVAEQMQRRDGIAERNSPTSLGGEPLASRLTNADLHHQLCGAFASTNAKSSSLVDTDRPGWMIMRSPPRSA